ncbi:MAG: hypothetical protein AB1609_19185 [Bacillota bacterium]
MDEIDALIERAEQLRKVPNGGYGGALVKANTLAAAHNLKTYPRTCWAEHPQAYAEHVDMLRRGVRFLERMATEVGADGRGRVPGPAR